MKPKFAMRLLALVLFGVVASFIINHNGNDMNRLKVHFLLFDKPNDARGQFFVTIIRLSHV